MDRLQILILSTPKTGNTWLVNLLAALYDLPKLGLLFPFNYEQASGLGERWVVFAHMMPEPALLDWIAEARPFVITTVRHPGDVLISLYHHLNSFSAEAVDLTVLQSLLTQPFERVDIDPPAVHTFHGELTCSLAWIRSGLTRVVRYEDLRCRTFETVRDLAEWILPASEARIRQAIARSDLSLMRSLAGKHGAFFRSGAVGEWRSVLSTDILEILAAEPYRQQLLELGYTLDLSTHETATHQHVFNPFNAITHFDNDVPVAPILIDFYLSLDPERNRQWPPLASSGPGSFLQWIIGPSDLEGAAAYKEVPLTRLAHYLHRSRPDLQQTFHDLTGPDRARYAEWFLREHTREYGLDPYFAATTRRGFLEWANSASELAGAGPYAGVPLSKFAHYLHETRPDLREFFPELTGAGRASYAEWFIRAYTFESLPDEDLTASTRESFFRWGREKAEVPAAGSYAALPLSKLAHHLHHVRPDLQRKFPNLNGPARAAYLEWFGRQRDPGPGLPLDFAAAARQSFRAWGNARHPLDRERRPWWPRLTNYALFIYETDPAVRAEFPDVFVQDRWNFLEWLVSPTSGLQPAPELTQPIRKSLGRLRNVRRFGSAILPRLTGPNSRG